jgi:pullulanase/glycogen debranching enzyme
MSSKELPEEIRNAVSAQAVWPGQRAPLGATFDGNGTNFSLFSEVAERVELCLFDDEGRETHVDLPEMNGYCWHGYLPDIRPGQRYGYRVHGAWAPAEGQRCNPAKLLLDPYARAIEGQVTWNEAVFPYHFDDPEGAANANDSAPFVPKSVVVDPTFEWGHDGRPNTALRDTVIYELHVKGFTARHPDIPPELRGTHGRPRAPGRHRVPAAPGVTAVELMPVHQFVHDAHPPPSAACATTGATTRSAFSHRTTSTRRRCNPARRSRSSGAWCARCTAPASEVIPRRRLQPYGRGNHLRTDAVVQGHRQRRILPAGRRRSALLHGLHRHRQQPEHAPSASCS